MTDERLQEIQQKIHYTFKNPALLKQAFVSPSVTFATQNRVQNYQVLEFIGDAVLEYVVVKQIATELCHLTPSGQLISTTTEGGLTEEKTLLVKNERLAQCSEILGFDGILEKAHGSTAKDHKNKKGDLIESILGAVAIDSDWDMNAASAVAMEILKHSKNKNFTEKLSNVCKSNKLPQPDVSFWDNAAGRFDCIVSIKMSQDGFIGSGRSREEAQNAASKSAVAFIKKQLKAAKKKETSAKTAPRGLLALATVFRDNNLSLLQIGK